VFDALFPIGSFTMSGGLETYTQTGIVHDQGSLTEYLNASLRVMPYGTLGFAAKAAMGGDLTLLDTLYGAASTSAELRISSQKLCARFMKSVAALGDYLRIYRELITAGECKGYYPIAAGLTVKESGSDIPEGLGLYCYSQLSLMTNIAVKLIPLRQLDGQTALAEAARNISDAVDTALKAMTDELGASGTGFELRSAQHETLSARLYIS
jgi:urease accessory protein